MTAPARRLDWINAMLADAWRRGWAPRPTLEPDVLVAAARAQTGLDDAGDPAWRSRLDILAADLAEHADLTPLGRTIAHGQLVNAIANRLRAHALWRRHPSILERPLAAPIIVLGQMRSGTTRVQRLLACDPALAHTRFFESWNPLPRWRLGPIDDRPWRARIGLLLVRLLNPRFTAIHPTHARAPDEEIGLHALSLFGSAFEVQWRVPRFAGHCEAMDTRPVYAEFRRYLQTLAHLRGEGPDRPWILKVPQLTQDADAVLATFPGARLVCLHRDREALVASSASLVLNQMTIQSNSVVPAAVGREWLRKINLREGRTAAARAHATGPQVDVAFDDVGADWEGEMARVYRALGLALSPLARARMARYVARSEGGSFHRHRYDLTDVGLTAADVQTSAAATSATTSPPLALAAS